MRSSTLIVLALAIAQQVWAQGGHEHMALWSTEEGGGELTAVWDFSDPTRTSRAFCAGGICLYSATNPALLFTGEEPPDGLHEIDDGTSISLELLARDAVAQLQINGQNLEPGESARLGAVPDLHVHPSWQLVMPEDERGDFELAFRLTAEGSGYEPSDRYVMILTNSEPPPTPTPGPVRCVGDCDLDGLVSVNELVRGVRIALGQTDLSECRNFDRDGNGEVSIAELIDAVRAAVAGCVPSLVPILESIQVNVFSPKCAIAFCHDSTTRAAGLSLAMGATRDELVDGIPQNPSARETGLRLVAPGDPDNSFLVIKVEGPAREFGSMMPLSGGALAAEEIDAIRDWIAGGAQP